MKRSSAIANVANRGALSITPTFGNVDNKSITRTTILIPARI